jgi:iron-sulfur cluster repair protein YtfE (RIC family)
MSSVSRYMRADRRYCDGLFDLIEPLGRAGKWGEMQQALLAFRCALERHLERGERVLFPALEEAHGSPLGLTRMLRAEHEDMRGRLTACEAAGARRDADALSTALQDLRIMMLEHNAREESVLYPLADALSAGQAGDLLQALERRAAGVTVPS